MKIHPSAQPLEFFDVELRVQGLEAKGNPLNRLDSVIDWEGFRPLVEQALAKPAKGPGGRPASDPVKMFKLLVVQRRNAGAIGMINLIYNLARYTNRSCAWSCCREPSPEQRRSKLKTTENQSTSKDQTSGKRKRKEPL